MTLFELTVVNNWYITMVRLSHLSVGFHQSPLCSLVIDQWVSLFHCCRVHSPTGRSHFYDNPLEPALLHDILHSYHGEACAVICVCNMCVEVCNGFLILSNNNNVYFSNPSWGNPIFLNVTMYVCDILCLQVVMTIIVAFILDAFVFRMNYSRKNREPVENPEGEIECVYNCVYIYRM